MDNVPPFFTVTRDGVSGKPWTTTPRSYQNHIFWTPLFTNNAAEKKEQNAHTYLYMQIRMHNKQWTQLQIKLRKNDLAKPN